MASHNTFPGYVKLPGKELYRHDIRLDFNPHLASDSEKTTLHTFSLRLFHLGNDHPEIAVELTTEQWLDLVEAMRVEFDRAQQSRKSLEDLQDGEEE